jgi:hypothetical protein
VAGGEGLTPKMLAMGTMIAMQIFWAILYEVDGGKGDIGTQMLIGTGFCLLFGLMPTKRD